MGRKGLKGCGCQEDRQLQGPWMTEAWRRGGAFILLIVRQTKHKATPNKVAALLRLHSEASPWRSGAH